MFSGLDSINEMITELNTKTETTNNIINIPNTNDVDDKNKNVLLNEHNVTFYNDKTSRLCVQYITNYIDTKTAN